MPGPAVARSSRPAAAACRPTSPSTGSRFATATCRGAGRSPPTRTSTRWSPAVPRWRAPAGLHGGADHTARRRRHRSSRRSRCTPASRPRSATSARIPSGIGSRSRPRGSSTPCTGGAGASIAAGTTVVRALETVALPDGTVAAGEGWTSLVVTPDRGVCGRSTACSPACTRRKRRTSTCCARASAGAAGAELREAIEHGYRWHEFGDSQLMLGTCPPDAARRGSGESARSRSAVR